MADLLEHLGTSTTSSSSTPLPLLPVTDAAILATITGGAPVVAAAGMVHHQQFADAPSSLQDVGAQVVGVVLKSPPAHSGRLLHVLRLLSRFADRHEPRDRTESVTDSAAPDLTRTCLAHGRTPCIVSAGPGCDRGSHSIEPSRAEVR